MGGIEEAFHLRLGEEVLAAAIDGRTFGSGASFCSHSLHYGSWRAVITARKPAYLLEGDKATPYRRAIL